MTTLKGNTTANDLVVFAKNHNIKLDAVRITRRGIHSYGNFIYLLIPYNNFPAGHWVALVNRPDYSLYFDSYGQSPPKYIVNTIKSNYTWNPSQIQNINMNHCGHFCLDFLNSVDSTDGPTLIKSYEKFIHKYRIINQF